MHWIFYDSYSKTQSNPLSLEEAQMAIFKMRSNDWTRFFIWTQGWSEWQSLDLFLKSEQKNFITHFSNPHAGSTAANENTVRDVLEMNPVDENTHKEITKSFSAVKIAEDSQPSVETKNHFDADELSWSNSTKPEVDFKKLSRKMSFSNREPRLELKIEVVLISPKGKTFRSKSANISLTGSLLEDNIPFDYYGIPFDVVVVNQSTKHAVNARVTLKAKTVGEGLTQRLNFIEITASQKKSLHGLLQDYLDEQKKLTRKSG